MISFILGCLFPSVNFLLLKPIYSLNFHLSSMIFSSSLLRQLIPHHITWVFSFNDTNQLPIFRRNIRQSFSDLFMSKSIYFSIFHTSSIAFHNNLYFLLVADTRNRLLIFNRNILQHSPINWIIPGLVQSDSWPEFMVIRNSRVTGVHYFNQQGKSEDAKWPATPFPSEGIWSASILGKKKDIEEAGTVQRGSRRSGKVRDLEIQRTPERSFARDRNNSNCRVTENQIHSRRPLDRDETLSRSSCRRKRERGTPGHSFYISVKGVTVEAKLRRKTGHG